MQCRCRVPTLPPETRYAQSLPTRVQRHPRAPGKVFGTLACPEEKCISEWEEWICLGPLQALVFQESKMCWGQRAAELGFVSLGGPD